MDPLCVQEGLSEFGCSIIGPGLMFVYILLGVALIAAIVLPIISTLKNPKVLVKTGISIGILFVIFLLAYAVADDSLSRIAVSKGITPSGSKLIGAGFITFYIALFTAILGLIYSEVSKAFK